MSPTPATRLLTCPTCGKSFLLRNSQLPHPDCPVCHKKALDLKQAKREQIENEKWNRKKAADQKVFLKKGNDKVVLYIFL